MKKKIRVGYVKRRWWLLQPKTNIWDFNYIQHSPIYRNPDRENYIKVRLIIEEIKDTHKHCFCIGTRNDNRRCCKCGLIKV